MVAIAISSSLPALHGIPFALNFVAISATAWLCGFNAGLVSIVASALLAHIFLLEPRYIFVIGKASSVQIVVVSAVSLFILLVARQRERNQLSLEKSEQVFRTLVDSISEGFASLDTDWNFSYINSHGVAFSNHTPEQLIGRNLWEVFPEAVGSIFEKTLKAASSERKVTRVTEYYPPLQKWIAITAYPAQDGISVLFQDVSEDIQNEERLRTADRLAIAGRLAATVSHEINNPLEAVGNFLFLARNEKSPEKIAQYVQEAEEQLFRASHIAKQTLTFYRGGNSPSNVSVAAAIRDAIRLFGGRFEGRAISIREEVEDGLAVFIAPGELVQVLVNLLSNAIDASPANSEVKVQAVRRENRAIISVSDAGPGIPPELESKIFDAFFTTKKDYGTGLGLWVCKNILEKQGGTIALGERTATGAVFVVNLPIAETASTGTTA